MHHFKKATYCKVITTEEGLQALEQDWRALSEQSAHPSIFATWEWALAWWQHFGADCPSRRTKGSLYVVSIYSDQDQLIGIAPFYHEVSEEGPFRSRRLRQLGDNGRWEAMTDEPILLFREGTEKVAVEALLHHLWVHNNGAHWDLFYLRLMSEKAQPCLGNSGSIQKFGTFLKEQKDTDGPQIVTLPATWEEFRKTLSKSMRDNLSYYPRRLVRAGHVWSVRELRGAAEVSEGFDNLVRLHGMRAKSDRGISHVDHIPTKTHQKFLETTLTQLAAQGKVFMAVLEVDGEVIAAQAFFEHAGMLTLYYSGYDPKWYDFSPITILNQEVLKSAIARGVRVVNFLPFPDQWKERWGAQSVLMVQELTCSCSRPASFARAIARKAYRGAWSLVLDSRPAPAPRRLKLEF